MSFGDYVIGAFDGLTPNLSSVYDGAKMSTVGGWRATQQSLVTGSGALAAAIPGFHMVGMAADVVFLMNRMSVCSYGIGAIIGFDNKLGNILEDEDFAVVLARWGGDENLTDAIVGKTCAELVAKVGGKMATKMLAKKAAECAGVLVGKKLAGKVGVKVGSKFGAKLGTKAVAGWVPFLGAAVSGGVNLWFITEIANAAEEWYKIKAAAANN